MKARRVLITGASGFVGRSAVAAFLRAGYKVRVATRNPTAFSKSVDIVTVPDFRKEIDWAPIVRGVDIVIHLAALVHADARESSFGDYAQINWLKTFELARAAKDAGVERFVFISSIRAQVGPSAPHVVRETDDFRPTDNYGRSKLAAELGISATGVPFTILRPVAIYGPQPNGNIKRLVQLAKSPLPLPFAEFHNRRSLLGIDNLIGAIFFVLNNRTTIDERFLVADPVPLTLSEILTLLRQAQGRKSGLIHVSPVAIRFMLKLFGQRRLWARINEDLIADTSKLEALGWRPTVGTYEGFCSMLSTKKAPLA